MGANSSKPDFSSLEEEDVSDDEDLVKSSDDLRAKGSRLSIESFDSGVSFKSDWSKDVLIDVKDRVSPSTLDLSSFEKKRDVADDGFSESPDDLRAVRRTLSEPAKSDFHIALRQQSPLMMAHSSVEAFGSGLTLMNDSFIRPQRCSLPRMVLKSMEAFGSGLSLMKDSFVRTGQRSPPRGPSKDDSLRLVELSMECRVRDQNVPMFLYGFRHVPGERRISMVKRMLESIDSGVSLKSDWSKHRPIDFKDRVSVIGLDFSSSVKKHVVADDGFFESPDDLEMLCCGISCVSFRRKDSQGCTADVKDTPPSPKEKMATGSLESIDSGVSLKSDQSKDEPTDFKDSLSQRRRMCQMMKI
ncbi:hypothetical protein ABVT39_004115 [Epinephelus coioides]